MAPICVLIVVIQSSRSALVRRYVLSEYSSTLAGKHDPKDVFKLLKDRELFNRAGRSLPLVEDALCFRLRTATKSFTLELQEFKLNPGLMQAECARSSASPSGE